MGFFTPGKETESKEGIDAAGAFYAHARPYEGLALARRTRRAELPREEQSSRTMSLM